jgi:hypothetical protein
MNCCCVPYTRRVGVGALSLSILPDAVDGVVPRPKSTYVAVGGDVNLLSEYVSVMLELAQMVDVTHGRQPR